MCLGLGLGCCFALIESIFYLGLVSFPLIGSFYGTDVVYRISIYLILHALLSESVSKLFGGFTPFFNIILFIASMFLPITLAPWPVIWIYSKLILLSEPVFKIAEGIVLLNVVFRKSQTAADEIDKDEDSAHLYKGAILFFSALCYGISSALVYDIFTTGTKSQLICLFVILCFCLAAHNMMLMAHEGIVSDCAFTCLINFGVLYVMMKEIKQTTDPTEPITWKQNMDNTSALDIILNIIFMSKDKAQAAITFFQRFFSPLFIVSLLIRLNSILFIVKKMSRNFFQEKDDDMNSQEENVHVHNLEEELAPPWRSPLLLKVSVIFMFTQQSAIFLTDWKGEATNCFTTLFQSVWPSDLFISRILQNIFFILFYLWRLYRAEDWTWNIWLTPE